MKYILPFLCAFLSVLTVKAQTEVSDYKPGVTEDGITYFLPTTRVRVVVTAQKKHHVPGEFCAYAERYLRIKDAPQTAYDEWKILDIKLFTYGVADKDKAYTIKLKSKTSAPLVGLADDGRLLSVNAQTAEVDAELPQPSVTQDSAQETNPQDFKTEEILAAGSTAKMAELTANEIYDIRENRALLTKGQADFMPKDGEQLKLMLAKLDTQENGLLQLFKGSVKGETHVFVFDITPTGDVARQQLFRFSKYLGMTDADDPAGVPYYFSIEDLKSLPATVQGGKPKKEVEDLRYVIPGRAKASVFTSDKVLASMSFPMAQFGRVEHLGGELFNKKYTTHVQLSPTTGGIVKIDAAKPE